MRTIGASAAEYMERAMAAAIILLMCAIVLQVAFSMFDINPVVTFGDRLFFVGKAITLNSLLDFQWHILVIVGLVPTGLVWLRDSHVRVDFLYSTYSDRSKATLNIAGNILLALPFLIMAIPASWDFMTRAWTSGEGSSNGGLSDLWLVKALLPLGLSLLLAAIAIETLRLIRVVR